MLGMEPFCRYVRRTGFSVGDSKVSVETNLPPIYKTPRISSTLFWWGPVLLFHKDDRINMKKSAMGWAIAPIAPPLHPPLTGDRFFKWSPVVWGPAITTWWDRPCLAFGARFEPDPVCIWSNHLVPDSVKSFIRSFTIILLGHNFQIFRDDFISNLGSSV